MTKEEVLERLVGAYTAYFNIRRDTELDGLPVAMDAEYHVHNEQYVLSREESSGEAENDEYAFVVMLEELNPENLRAHGLRCFRKRAWTGWIPGPTTCAPTSLCWCWRTGSSRRRRQPSKSSSTPKSLSFTLRGWAQFRAAALEEVSTGQTYANGLGRAVLKDLGRHLSV